MSCGYACDSRAVQWERPALKQPSHITFAFSCDQRLLRCYRSRMKSVEGLKILCREIVTKNMIFNGESLYDVNIQWRLSSASSLRKLRNSLRKINKTCEFMSSVIDIRSSFSEQFFAKCPLGKHRLRPKSPNSHHRQSRSQKQINY